MNSGLLPIQARWLKQIQQLDINHRIATIERDQRSSNKLKTNHCHQIQFKLTSQTNILKFRFMPYHVIIVTGILLLPGCNHCYLNIVHISGALFILSLSMQQESGRDVNNIGVTMVV